MSREAMDFLMNSGGSPSAKFPSVGTVVKGRVVSMEKQQQTDIDTDEPLTWPNGQPKYQVVITLATDERDSSIENDDGTRRVYAKYKLLEAVRKAVRDSGYTGDSLEGGELAIKFSGEEPPKRRGMSPTKLYQAKYTPPDPAAASDLFDDEPGSEPVGEGQAAADDDIPF